MGGKKVLVLGATGYIGGRLVPRLVDAGYSVRCMVRDPRKMEGRPWKSIDVVAGDVLDKASLRHAANGCSMVYYLVRAMGRREEPPDEKDRIGALNMCEVAAEVGMDRIIYLGGVGRGTAGLSPILRSRREVGEVLASGRVPVTELRATMIVGSGSAFFDMLHALVNRLPVLVLPKWASTLQQPVSTRDVLHYLVASLGVSDSSGTVIDIGGSDVLSTREMMVRFARILELRRLIFVLPVHLPRLSAFWVNLVTPIPTFVARRIVESLRSELVCSKQDMRSFFEYQPRGFDEAVTHALKRVRDLEIETTWSSATHTMFGDAGLEEQSQLLSNTQRIETGSTAERVYNVFISIGGANGWYYANVLWRIRGFLDKFLGGVGLRRGRRHPFELVSGDALDFWRVESVEPGKKVTLRAEMKVPGRAWLEFSVEHLGVRRSLFTQTALFYPRGVWGLLYWYGIYPVHILVFRGMARAIVRRAEQG